MCELLEPLALAALFPGQQRFAQTKGSTGKQSDAASCCLAEGPERRSCSFYTHKTQWISLNRFIYTTSRWVHITLPLEMIQLLAWSEGDAQVSFQRPRPLPAVNLLAGLQGWWGRWARHTRALAQPALAQPAVSAHARGCCSVLRRSSSAPVSCRLGCSCPSRLSRVFSVFSGWFLSLPGREWVIH